MAFVQLEGLGKRYGEIDAVVATNLSVEKRRVRVPARPFRLWQNHHPCK